VVCPSGWVPRSWSGSCAFASNGTLRELLRTGDLLGGNAIVGLQTLAGVPGALGASRGFNARGTVTARVQMARGAQAILRIDVPEGKARITESLRNSD
jgi:hypothetical protein